MRILVKVDNVNKTYSFQEYVYDGRTTLFLRIHNFSLILLCVGIRDRWLKVPSEAPREFKIRLEINPGNISLHVGYT